LADFLRAARATKAKFLLTSRRDERDWLGRDLPARITLPPMPMQEMLELTRELARPHQRHIEDIDDWRPLLRFTEGNPLTLTVLVGQALRVGLKTRTQIEAFVERLRAGEAVFDDEVSEGRTRSLGASLNYGFENAFNEAERKQVALLRLFQGLIDVGGLTWMGNPEGHWCLPEVRGLTREEGIALLDRAAAIGLLTAHGGGYYRIHPALPWFFRRLFEEHYAGRQLEATRAFVEAMGELGYYYHREYEDGNRDVISALSAEEANLLHARRLARVHGWWDPVTRTMQGLRVLYRHAGRRAEWARLVEEIVPNFVDPTTDGPLPGREEEWSLVTGYRVGLAMEAMNWPEAERLQGKRVAWDRQCASGSLAVPTDRLDSAALNRIRALAVSVEALGHIRREQDQAECVAAYEEALLLAQRIGDDARAAISAFNLGHAYLELPRLRDLDRAERWYRRSLEQVPKNDWLGQARCHNQLGRVAHERFEQARSSGKPEVEPHRLIDGALREYHTALDLLPPSATSDLAVTHHQLGVVYSDAGDLDRALHHYRESIRLAEMHGDFYGAASTRYNVALALASAGRLRDALEYSYSALSIYQTYGDRLSKQLARTYRLIAELQLRLAPAAPAPPR
jgi:tetratricopeptide (TPR) repeat protein